MDNSIPALERTLRVFEALESSPVGLSAASLAALADVPRTTLYRILRVLSAKGYVVPQQNDANLYELGPALLRLAARTRHTDYLVLAAQPVLDALCARLGETVKLVVREGVESVAVAVSYPLDDSRIRSRVGARKPLHIGAGQRLLLAHAPANIREAVLNAQLDRPAPETITDPQELERNLQRLATRDWEFGKNEGTSGLASVAAIVREQGLPARAAIIVLYIQGTKSREALTAMRHDVVAAAQTVARAMAG
jgi:DNA-binding IclR family transcriptional regulator